MSGSPPGSPAAAPRSAAVLEVAHALVALIAASAASAASPASAAARAHPSVALVADHAVLDASALPHIILLIAHSADLPSLLSWRATSRHFRDWADARLFRHVAASTRRVTGQVELRTPAASSFGPYRRLPCLPYFPPYRPRDSLSDDGLDTSPPRRASRHTAADTSRLRQYALVLRLDDMRQTGTDRTPDFPSLQVLRRGNQREQGIPAPHVVDYITASAPTDEPRHAPAARSHIVALPRGVESYVVHIAYRDDSARVAILPAVSSSVRSLTVVFAPRPAWPPPEPLFDAHRLPDGIMTGPTISAAGVAGRGGSVKFVGLEGVPPPLLNLPPMVLGSELCAAMRPRILAVLSNVWEWARDEEPYISYPTTEEQIADAHDHVSFPSLQEWQASVDSTDAEVIPNLPSYTLDRYGRAVYRMDSPTCHSLANER